MRARRYTDGDKRFLIVDPLCTFFFAFLVIWVSKDLVKDIVVTLMEATPKDVSVDVIMERLGQVRRFFPAYADWA